MLEWSNLAVTHKCKKRCRCNGGGQETNRFAVFVAQAADAAFQMHSTADLLTQYIFDGIIFERVRNIKQHITKTL